MPTKTELTCIAHASIKKMSEDELMQWKKETFERYSQPTQSLSLLTLKKQFPHGKETNTQFIVDSGSERRIFDENGREIVHEWYKSLIPDKVHAFDVYRRITSIYDEEGYVTFMTEMQLGKIGYTTKLIYAHVEHGRILSHAVITNVDRQGVMDPGMPVAKPETITFL